MRHRLTPRIKFPIGFVAAVLCLCFSGGAATPIGFVEGQVKIISVKEVELSGTGPSKSMGGNYADYPLVVVNRTTGQQIVRITADRNGVFRLELPPGDYLLSVERGRGGISRSTSQSFTVSPQQTVRVNMEIDTGVR